MPQKVMNHHQPDAGEQRQLFAIVETFDANDEQIGSRIVDMYHYGTRNWLQKHVWWAMHNNCTVEQRLATDDEVTVYIAEAQEALAQKYNAHA